MVTNPLNWTLTTTLDPARGSTLTTVDMNGYLTEATYDALGRRTQVWLPNRPCASNPTSPSSSHQYTISNTAPSWTSTTTITAAGSPATGYLIASIGVPLLPRVNLVSTSSRRRPALRSRSAACRRCSS